MRLGRNLWAATVCILAALIPTAAVKAAPEAGLRRPPQLYYRSGWRAPQVHRQAQDGWRSETMLPRVGPWFSHLLPPGLKQMVFHNGQAEWDHAPGGGNYSVRKLGRDLFIQNGRITHAPPGLGRIEKHTVNGQEFSIQLPAGYDEFPERRYPVLFMVDGQNLFEHGPFGSMDMHKSIRRITERGLARQVIVVGIHTTDNRYNNLTPSFDPEQNFGGNADHFLNTIEHELVPFTDQHFRTMANAEHRGLGGSSLGGVFAIYGGIKRPHLFRRIMAISPSSWWHGEELKSLVEKATHLHESKFYLDSGGSGRNQDAREPTERLRDAFASRPYMQFGVNLMHWLKVAHEHGERDWKKRMPRGLSWLFPAAEEYAP